MVTRWSRRAGQPTHSGGQRWFHQGTQGEKKSFFPKFFLDHLGLPKQVFLGHFEPVVARFGPWKIPKCLENGPFWDQQCVKNGSKTCFSKSDPGPFMMLKQLVLGHFEPVATGFGPWNTPKCLEMGPFWEQNWVDNGSKTRFSKSDRGPFGMLKQVFLALFEPVLTEFSPFHHMYAPLCALRSYRKWWLHHRCGFTSLCQRALYRPSTPDMSEKRPKKSIL